MSRRSKAQLNQISLVHQKKSSTDLVENDNGKQSKSFEHILIMYQINFYTLDEWLGWSIDANLTMYTNELVH